MMGIRPNRDGLIPPVTPDNPETRYSDWLTELEDSGEIVGGVWKETDAKATSASNGISDLAGRVAALEAGELNHKHVSADITDARHYVYPNVLLKMDGSGNFHVANPTEETHPAHKRYVDAEVKAVTDSTSDLASRVEALETEGVEQHTHVSADITDARHYVAANRLLKMDVNGNINVANPTSETHPAHKRYVDAEVKSVRDSTSDDISGLDGRVTEVESGIEALETAEVKPHTHTSADITDARHYVVANRLLKMDGNGNFHVADPTEETHPAHKRYVDTEVKAIKDNAVPYIGAERIVRRGADSLFHVAEPTAVSHPASKQYVDKSGLDRLFVVRAASTGYNPATVIAGLPTGQAYLDLRDMSINVKE